MQKALQQLQAQPRDHRWPKTRPINSRTSPIKAGLLQNNGAMTQRFKVLQRDHVSIKRLMAQTSCRRSGPIGGGSATGADATPNAPRPQYGKLRQRNQTCREGVPEALAGMPQTGLVVRTAQPIAFAPGAGCAQHECHGVFE